VITARINGLLHLKELGLDSIFPLSPSLSRQPVYHYLHETSKSLVPRIDVVFRAMEESGELERVRQRVIKDMLERGGISKPH